MMSDVHISHFAQGKAFSECQLIYIDTINKLNKDINIKTKAQHLVHLQEGRLGIFKKKKMSFSMYLIVK